MSEEQAPVTLEDMDKAIEELVAKREEYKDADKISKALYHEAEALERKVLDMMQACEKDTYIGGGVRVGVTYKMSVTTPKTPEDKLAFFEWLKQNKGEDVMNAYMTVNSQSLNSLYNELTEEAAARGEILQVAGLQEPTARIGLSIRKQ